MAKFAVEVVRTAPPWVGIWRCHSRCAARWGIPKIDGLSGWWFGGHFWHFPIWLGNNHHPKLTFHIFQRGGEKPPTSDVLWKIPMWMMFTSGYLQDECRHLRRNAGPSIPRCSMYGIFTYIWVIFRVNVGKYSIHGAYGYENGWWLGVPLFQETSICVSELPGTTWSYHFTHEHRQKTAVLILHLTFETISHLIDSLQIVEFPYLI